MDKHSAGAWLVVDLQSDAKTVRELGRRYELYAQTFPALFTRAYSDGLFELATSFTERAKTIEALMNRLPGSIPVLIHET